MSACGAANPNWRGGRRRGGEGGGYWLIYAPDHPAAVRGCVLEHRLVMERHLGRYLERAEVVHHRNGDTLDNRVENLELLVNQAEHALHHVTEEFRHFSRPTDRVPHICEGCGATFEATGQKRHRRRFCSRPCYLGYRRGRGRLERGVAA